MFRFNEPSKEWKERGTGDVRFLKHKESGKVRIDVKDDDWLTVASDSCAHAR